MDTELEANIVRFLLVWLGDGLLLTVGPILLKFCHQIKNGLKLQTLTWRKVESADGHHQLFCPEVDAALHGGESFAVQGRLSAGRPAGTSLPHDIGFHPSGRFPSRGPSSSGPSCGQPGN